MKVYVVTDAELGWDCVLGVFTSIEHYNSWSGSDYISWEDLENAVEYYHVSDYDIVCEGN